MLCSVTLTADIIMCDPYWVERFSRRNTSVLQQLKSYAGAEPRFGICALRLRALASLLLARERRRIAHPKGSGLRRFSKCDYTRDLRPAKWGLEVSLHGSKA
jgi:hypothetical protein